MSRGVKCDTLFSMIFPIFITILCIFLISLAYAASQGAPWVPTWNRDLKRIDALLDLQPGEQFVELGCGNARVCRYLKKQRSETVVVGVELSLIQFCVGWMQNRFTHTPVEMRLENAFKQDLSTYDAVYLFLMPETYEKIRQKLEKELKPGARVVTYVWPIPDWEPTKVDTLEGAPKLYLYKK